MDFLTNQLFLLNNTNKIGCGNGIVLEHIAKKVGCRCAGIECDIHLAREASQRLKNYSGSVYPESFETFDWTAVNNEENTYIYLFLSHFGYSALTKTIINNFRCGTKVVTLVNPMGDVWKPDAVWLGDDNDLSLYLHTITEDLKSQILSTSSSSTLQNVWIHPPPGSYYPIPVPRDVTVIPFRCQRHDIEQLSNEVPAVYPAVLLFCCYMKGSIFYCLVYIFVFVYQQHRVVILVIPHLILPYLTLPTTG